eukprot:CAMPEP_0197441106 /NCGR_PEP_ID=MMETSP1175-20131217/7455_1 /TAXON_ID=1003142 /ORGANISM="Triceratium dubium, Strain CCMP147" /LENGTH=390 /DNA_ID=CAMNT_0042971333 /DNA_START=269 /DNA_END=1441 /DNA_ORIENTATION=+
MPVLGRKWSPDRDLKRIAANNPHLNQVDWIGKGIGDDEVFKLVKALRHNTNVTKLYLGDNNISDIGAKDVAEMLRLNATITELWLDSTKITDFGMKALAEMLQTNASVTHLWMDNNKISADLVHKVHHLVMINRVSSSPEEARRRKDTEFGPPPHVPAEVTESLSSEHGRIEDLVIMVPPPMSLNAVGSTSSEPVAMAVAMPVETSAAAMAMPAYRSTAASPLSLSTTGMMSMAAAQQELDATSFTPSRQGSTSRRAHHRSEQERRDRELAKRLQREEEQQTRPPPQKTVEATKSSYRKLPSQSSKLSQLKQFHSQAPPSVLDTTKKSTSSTPLINRVRVLEEHLLPGEVAPSISERISSLEMMLFGCTKEDKGSFMKRVAHLENELGLE